MSSDETIQTKLKKYIGLDSVKSTAIDHLMTPIKTKIQRDNNILIMQDDLYIIEWETDFEPIFESPIPYQDPNVIESRGIMEKITLANLGNQKTDDGQNLTVDPVLDQPTS